MKGPILRAEGIKVATARREILHGIDLEINAGETVVLMGANGAGKSTLLSALAGTLELTAGKIRFNNKDITNEPLDERARRGLLLAWQAPVEIPGVSTWEMLRSISDDPKLGENLTELTKSLDLDPFLIQRDLNVGLSGGEKKKMEILQLLALNPKVALLDETDSGLDVDAAKSVAKTLRTYQKKTNLALVIVTHNARILQGLKIDKTYVLASGRVVKAGDEKLVEQILKQGFKAADAGA